MINVSRSLFALASLALGESALAQDLHLAVSTPNSSTPELLFLNVDAGAVLEEDRVLLNPLMPAPARFLAVEWVGNEIWMVGVDGLRRFSVFPVSFLGEGLLGESFGSIIPTNTGAFLFSSSEAVEVDLTGTVVQRKAISAYDDIAAFQGGYLAVVNNTTIEQLDTNFLPIGSFGANANQIATTVGTVFAPDKITVLSNGSVAVAATVSVAIIDSSGVAQNVFNPGQFESAALETSSGLIYVPASFGTSLLDTTTGEALRVTTGQGPQQAKIYSTSTRRLPISSSSQGCNTTPNSVGSGALFSLLGSDFAQNSSLTLVASDLPPGQFCITIYGSDFFSAPFGSGVLCVSPFAPGIIRSGIGLSSFGGNISTEMDFVTPGFGASFLPGTSWNFQVIYRDVTPTGAATFNTSSSARLTFRP